MKPLSNILLRSAWLFILFSLPLNTGAEAFVAVNLPTPTETVPTVQQQKQNKKQLRKQQRKQIKKWVKTNRKKLGLSAGLLSIFSLLAWRRKFKKLKIKESQPSGSDNDGCSKFLGTLILIGLVSLLGKWLLKSIFGVMVGFWLGALLAFAAISLVFLIAILIAKAINGEF